MTKYSEFASRSAQARAQSYLPAKTVPKAKSGGLTGDAMICFESAVIRPDQSSISTGTDGPDGALINIADSFYMRVNDGFTGYRTFNIQSGANETPPENAKSIHFAKWQAGLIVDNKFAAMLSFPRADRQT
jgi:hypothetical protein